MVEELGDTDVNIATGISFPFGSQPSAVKAMETEMAVKAGCTCLDMVINIGALKDKKYDIVGIDEVQFFSSEIIQLIDELINQDTRVIVAGLDLDFRGEPFGVMPTLLAKAEFVTKLTAACKICGEAATRTQRIIDGKPALYDSPIILVGAKDSYEARCHKHHIVPKK